MNIIMNFKPTGFSFISKKLQTFVLLMLTGSMAWANIKLPSVIADGMVLQQKTKVTLWGWASPGEGIAVAGNWSKDEVLAKADAEGKWKINIATPAASKTGFTLTFRGKNTIELKNVLIGEVWLCSGQSNMKFTIAKGPASWETGVNDFEAEVAKINNSYIREYTVKETVSDTLMHDTQGEWQEANPTNARLFSAVAYYYAREIYAKTGFPIGLIASTWGGTPAEAWTKKEVLQSDADLNAILTRYEKALQTFPQDTKNYQVALAQWQKDTSAARLQNIKAPKGPAKPANPMTNSKSPYKLYNGMIAPIINYTVKGVIWYQGESNADYAYQYRKLFPAMIKGWRDDHHDANLPFYFVQISPHYTQNAEIREAQLMAYRNVPHTGMVVTTDNGDSANVHPRNKELVGKRLALWPLAHDYGFKDLPYSGPLYKSMKVEGDKIRISFDEVGDGLVAKDGDLKEFTIAGEDHVFHGAQAKIEGNTLVVSSPLVSKPVAVRFAWRSIPYPNLYNKAGLPASPFRTDDWPGITYGKN
ncbi:MAG: sialate O-acetylesterase [Bacteroidota bacterium]